MFPYKNELQDIKALNAYKPSDINAILELAKMNNLGVIPLIQTFGHFEFVLKLKNYKHLREISKYPQVLCPSHKEVFSVIRAMIDQMLEAHPEAKYIHLGCDEVFHIGKCDKCTRVMEEKKWKTTDIFLSHVKTIAQYINKTYPGVRPIVWGDMFADVDEELIQKYQIANLTDIMVWEYKTNVSEFLTFEVLSNYAKSFKTIWIASAFKGATAVNQIVTDARHHLTNHMSWMKIVSKWKKHINFKGIALTGWQRRDHFSILCELLPVAIPSLTLSMQYLKGIEKDLHSSAFLNVLQCDSSIPFSPSDLNYITIFKCNFPGFSVFQLVTKLYVLLKEIKHPVSSLADGWLSVDNIIHKFSSPNYVEQLYSSWPYDHYRIELKYMEEELRKAMSDIYDEYTIDEWISTYIIPVQIRLEAIYFAKEALLSQDVWPRRPLLNSSDFLRKTASKICDSKKNIGCGLLMI